MTAEEVCSFVNACPTPMHVVENARRALLAAGYTELREAETWGEVPDKFFVARDERALIAVNKTDVNSGIVIGTNIDAPCLRAKPNTKLANCGLEQVRVSPYGDWPVWTIMDRGLRAAGRVIYKEGEQVKSGLFNTEKAIAIVPSLAVHLERGSSRTATFNPEIHFMPVVGLTPAEPLPESDHCYFVLEEVAKCVGVKPEDVIDFDLSFYDENDAKITGIDRDMIVGGRLSNYASAYLALKAFLAQEKPEYGLRALVFFDAMLIRSNLRTGANSNFLSSVMKRIGCGPSFFDESVFVGLDNVEGATNENKTGEWLGRGVVGSRTIDECMEIVLDKMSNVKWTSDTRGILSEKLYELLLLNGTTIGIPVLGKKTAREAAAINDLDALSGCLSELLAQ